jgi:hypothetical protein
VRARHQSTRARPGALVAILLGLSAAACAGGGGGATPVVAPAPDPAAVIEDVEHRTFRWFWDSANPANGLVPDRAPTPSFSSIAAIGFALTAYPAGVERGWVTRTAAASRTETTLKFLRDLPQGPEATGTAGYHGFFYHFLDMGSGLRYQNTELSTVDTALLMAGVLTVASYFDKADATEVSVRALADELYRRVDWAWAMSDPSGLVAMGWKPDTGLYTAGWRGYNEAMILYVLGLGSPTHPLPGTAWGAWASTYGPYWKTEYGQTYLSFPPLFGHQFSHIWVDFRGIQDAFMRDKGSDYFKNSRAAVYAQQAYAVANPMAWKDYGATIFGVTASDGPGDLYAPYHGETRHFLGYAGRGMGGAATFDDGTIAPMGAAASIAFAPEIVVPAILEMQRRYGDALYSTYGFLDAFNPSYPGTNPAKGRVVAGLGWFDNDYLGIDQGPIVAMTENYRSELIWRLMRQNPYLRTGLQRAGFTGGWLGTP